MSKVPALAELSRLRPTSDEIDSHFAHIEEQPGRIAAISLGAMLDALLEDALMINMLVLDQKRFEELFRDSYAPLGTWSAKIQLAHVLGIITDRMRPQMDRVRRIRNAFAHAVKPLDFDNPTIIEECNKLDCRSMAREDVDLVIEDESPRGLYQVAAMMMALHVLEYLQERQAAIKAGRVPRPAPFQSKVAGS